MTDPTNPTDLRQSNEGIGPVAPAADTPRAPAFDPWLRLAAGGPARIALGRAGVSLPTRAVLDLAAAHAAARDAVHARLDVVRMADAATAHGLVPLAVRSVAIDRMHYLTRPDHGRRMDAPSRAALARAASGEADAAIGMDLVIVIADGLSANAVHAHAMPIVLALQRQCAANRWSLAPLVIATGARVAIGDEIAAVLGARAALVLIGERPGLSSPDSLGAYLTYGPDFTTRRLTDADRNCVSNIRAAGLPPEAAATRIAWLIAAAFARGATGVALKDDSEQLVVAAATPAAQPIAPVKPSA